MMNRRLKKASAVLLAMTMIFSLAGCVDQSQGKKSSDSTTQTESSTDESDSSKTADKKTSDSKSDKDSSNEDAKSLLEIDDPEEKAAVEAAKPSSDSSSLDTENPVNSSEGLSLSTAKDGTSDSDSDSGNTSFGNRIFQIALAVVVTGLILLGAVSGVIYFFRKNWKRWGGAEDDDE